MFKLVVKKVTQISRYKCALFVNMERLHLAFINKKIIVKIRSGPSKVFGNRRTRAFFMGTMDQMPILRGLWEQRQYWGIGSIKRVLEFYGTDLAREQGNWCPSVA